VALGCGVGGATGGSDSAAGGNSGTGQGDGSDDKPAAAKIGDPARDGKFEFTVTKLDCGKASVGKDPLSERAQGQFCLVTLDVANIGKEPQSFSDSDQKAFDADGTEFSTNTTAGLYANKNADTFYKEINPGNKITAVLVFDVPKETKLAKLELHDSFLSGGVTVELA
jgi:hypothetical protein